MTPEHFNTQMNRLAEQFGKAAYSRERAQLIWREVKDFSALWFSKVIDELIGSSRHAPLLPEFREKISIERERGWSREKEQHAKDAKDFFAANLPVEESRVICQYIVKRLQKQVSDQDWASFLDNLEYLGKRI